MLLNDTRLQRIRSRSGWVAAASALTFTLVIAPRTVLAQTTWHNVELRYGHGLVSDRQQGRLLLYGGNTLQTTLDETWTSSPVDGSWQRQKPSASPGALFGTSIAYFSSAAHPSSIVAFGGRASSGVTKDTVIWDSDSNAWLRGSFSVSPEARMHHAMSFDAQRGRVLMFGGFGTRNDLADFWTFDRDLMQWQQIQATGPAPRHGHSLAYDPLLDIAVLFGGMGRQDTWVFDFTAQTWTQITVGATPTGGNEATLAFDHATNKLLLFGGRRNGIATAETFSFDLQSGWTKLSPATSPSARSEHAMAYDPALRMLVMFGGLDDQGQLIPDTWGWTGATWMRVLPPPSSRGSHWMVYDEDRKEILLFGGGRGAQTALRDTWTWNGTRWTEKLVSPTPPERGGHRMTYDAQRKLIVLVGGGDKNNIPIGDVWEWNGSSWIPQPSPGPEALRHFHTQAFDPIRRTTLVFSGLSIDAQQRPIVLDDFKEWDGSSWKKVAASSLPPKRIKAFMTTDKARGRVVLFGGETSLCTFLNDTWEWDGQTWTQMTPTQAPSPRAEGVMIYDEARRRVVIYGGRNCDASGKSVIMNDTWEWDGIDWHAMSTAASPTQREAYALAYDGNNEETILFGGVETRSTPFKIMSDTWSYGATKPSIAKQIGTACPGLTGSPELARIFGPWMGAEQILRVSSIRGSAPVAFLLGPSPIEVPIPRRNMTDCILRTVPVLIEPRLADALGVATWTAPVPNSTSLLGARWVVQAAIPGGSLIDAMSSALDLQVGQR